ncbi:MAG: hypothetical protein FLDDKLPJ_03507 [Phycisphaerae bacterium]|nr:hypothetical protein [Phycisphaerae bacterium]
MKLSMICVAGLGFALTALAAAGQEEQPPADPRTVPHETQDMTPDDDVEPIGVCPAVRFEYGQGRYTTVQVNVNGQGDNILGDAANEPSIALDPTNPNRMAIGWRQFDTVNNNFREAGRAFTTDGGQTWTFPGVLTNGTFRSDPVLAADRAGTIYYCTLKNNFLCDMFLSTDGGATFGSPIAAYGGDKEWMAIDTTGGMGDGHLYLAWSTAAGCCGNRIFTRSTDGGLSYLNPITLPSSPIWGTLAVAGNGDLYVCGSDAFSTFIVVRSTNADDPGQTPTFSTRNASINLGGTVVAFGGPNPEGLAGQLYIAVDTSGGPRNGHLYLLSTVDPSGNDPADVKVVRSTDGGATWSAPVRVNDDASTTAWQWFGTMSIAPSGRLDAVWNDTRNTGNTFRCQTFYAYSTDGGATWSPNEATGPEWNSSVGWPQQNKIGDYYHMISDGVGAHLAYATTLNNEQDVYYMRVAVDCNGNGVHDGDDIASGRSGDANHNWIPDECEGADCNRIDKFNVGCINGRLKAKVVSTLAAGTILTVDNNGDRRTLTINDRGKGKVKWTGQSGAHTVFIVECPQFTRSTTCN